LFVTGGFGADDCQLMNRKIAFLSSLQHHVNVVTFVGSYVDPDLGSV